MSSNGDYPDDEWVRSTCKVGQRHLCCRYLTMSPSGWSCEKRSSLKALIDLRVANGQFSARGDNCPGKDHRG